jgi:hypothetical protein
MYTKSRMLVKHMMTEYRTVALSVRDERPISCDVVSFPSNFLETIDEEDST